MPVPTPGRQRKWLLLLGVAVFLPVFALILPLLVEQVVLPRVLENAGLAGYRAAVSRFGPRGCTLHITETPKNAFFSTGTLQLDWTVTGLLRGRVQRMAGIGLLINAAPPAFDRSPAKSPGTGVKEPPLLIDRLELRNCFLALPRYESSLLLPLSFAGQRQEQAAEGGDPLQYQLLLHVAGQELSGNLTTNPAGHFNGTGRATLNFSSLSAALAIPDRQKLQGSSLLDIEFSGMISPLRLDRLSITSRLDNFQTNPGQALTLSSATGGALITLSGADKIYRLQGSNFILGGAMDAELAFACDISNKEGIFSWQGNVTLLPGTGRRFGDQAVLDQAQLLTLSHQGRRKEDGIEINLQADAPATQGQSLYALRFQGNLLQMERLTAKARAVVLPQNAAQWLTIDFAIRTGLSADFANGRVRIPSAAFQGTAVIPADPNDKRPTLRGQLELTDGSLALNSPKLRMQAINLTLPLTWPGQADTDQGELQIKDVFLDQARLAAFDGVITQAEDSFSLKGETRSVLLPENSINVNADLQPFRPGGPFARATWSAAQSRISVQDLALLHPSLKPLTGTARLDLKGQLLLDQCGLRGSLAANVQNGNIAIAETDLHLENISFNLGLPHLPELETAPAQRLHIGTVRSRKIEITDLDTAFRIESPDSLFIENISAGWSGGRIFISGLRLHKDLSELEFALICNHLRLAEVLSQLGLAEAEGVGTVSGRIPVVYQDRQIRIDNGFLFTPPGEQGILKIRKSNHLDVNLPRDTPQLSPLHFAGAALRDFGYNWARLNLLSQEDNLLLKLQIDGKPRQRLPYRFDAQNSVFARLKEGAPGGIDQPVKLDVNFTVPLNEMLSNQQIPLPLLRNLK
ncbi:MAG: intermembrane phospholipid transport protein YdbH family protein [Thermodesulfobacteriota bacterium]